MHKLVLVYGSLDEGIAEKDGTNLCWETLARDKDFRCHSVASNLYPSSTCEYTKLIITDWEHGFYEFKRAIFERNALQEA
jgi:hypothetical protein